MKTKGITIWERYVHYMVLGVAALIFVAFAAMQFLTEPNAVQGTGKNAQAILPGEADSMLESAAKRIQEKLSGPSPIEGLENQQSHFSEFENRLAASISPVERLAISNNRFSPATIFAYDSGAAKKSFVVPTIPAATKVVAREYWDTLTQDSWKQYEALQKMYAKELYDIHWITAGAEFNLKDVLASYTEKGPNGELPIPSPWYQGGSGGVDVLDIRAEREEFVSGEWTGHKVLDPIPGQFSFRTELSGKADAALRNKLLSMLKSDPARETSIIEPPFYGTVNESWAPPDVADQKMEETMAADPTQRKIADMKSDIADLKKKIADSEKQIKDLNCPAENAPQPPPKDEGGNKPSGGGPGGGPGFGGAGLRGNTNGQDNPDVLKAKCERLRNKLKNLQRVLEKTIKDLADLDAQAAAAAAVVVEEKESDTVKIWAHDLTTEPGKTYRYRFIVHVYNPFFARKRELIESQYSLADSITLASEASEWTKPITATLPLQIFVTDVSDTGRQNMSGAPAMQARAEVFRFSGGRWWSNSFMLQSGDQVGGVKDVREAVKMPEKDDTKPTTPTQPSTPSSGPPGTGPGGPSRGSGTGTGSGNTRPGGERPTQPTLPKKEEPKQEYTTKTIDFSTEWFVLAVVNDAWGGKVVLQNLRDTEQMWTVAPAESSTDPRYRHLKQEVKLSEI